MEKILVSIKDISTKNIETHEIKNLKIMKKGSNI